MGEPAFLGIPLLPFQPHQILQGQGEPWILMEAPICVTPDPADLVQPVLRVAPETRQPRPC